MNGDELPKELATREYSQLTHLYDALERVDVELLLVYNNQFRSLDKELLHEKIVIGTKGIWYSGAMGSESELEAHWNNDLYSTRTN